MEQNDLKILKIIQKAREFADKDLLNEHLIKSLLNAEFKELSREQKEQIAAFLNAIVESKEKAMLS